MLDVAVHRQGRERLQVGSVPEVDGFGKFQKGFSRATLHLLDSGRVLDVGAAGPAFYLGSYSLPVPSNSRWDVQRSISRWRTSPGVWYTLASRCR